MHGGGHHWQVLVQRRRWLACMTVTYLSVSIHVMLLAQPHVHLLTVASQ